MFECRVSKAIRFCINSVSALSRVMMFGMCAFLPQSSTAQEFVENQTNSALSAFYGLCLNEMFDFDQVRSLADRLDWETISGDELEVFVPQIDAEIIEYAGYLAVTPDDPPLPMAAFVGKSIDPDGMTEHCSLFFKDVLPEEFLRAFAADTVAKLIRSEKKAAGRTVFYSVPEFPEDFVLIESQTRGRGLRATFLMRKVGG